MVLWIFGYGSLVWKAGFEYNEKMEGYIKGYKRVFYQGSTDHRGTPESPGRTVTLESSPDAITWGAVYGITGGPDAEAIAMSYLEVREKQYDVRLYVDFFTKDSGESPALQNVLVYIGSTDKASNPNYLGPASLSQIAEQIAFACGPSGPNTEYLFKLESALREIGGEDDHVTELAARVRLLIGAQ